jgi:hypothetical protein
LITQARPINATCEGDNDNSENARPGARAVFRSQILESGAASLTEESMSTFSTSENALVETTNYGGLVDAVGGIATIVLAIIALAGVHPAMLIAITTIVFGAALLIQGGTMLSEYTHMMFPAGTAAPVEEFGGGGLSAVFLVGAAGMVLGVLALLGIEAPTLTAIAVIAFGAALVLSSNAVWHLYRMKRSSVGARAISGGEILASEMASGSAAIQCLAGLAVIVLGILAVSGVQVAILTLVGLLILGATVLLTGSTLSGAAMAFMQPTPATRRSTWSAGAAE